MAIIAWTLLWLGLAFVIYKYVFNPQVVIQATVKNSSKCPERWTFKEGMCHPDYDTKCVPFDPSKLITMHQRCGVAKQCGTNWSRMCL